MKPKQTLLVISLFVFLGFTQGYATPNPSETQVHADEKSSKHNGDEGHQAHEDHAPSPLAVIPFVLLLGMIATGPSR